MGEWWDALSTLQKIFAGIALPATLLLIIQTVLVIIGIGGGADTDGVDGIDGADGIDGVDDADGGGADGPDGLSLFSVRGIIGFLCVGGWAGIALDGAGVHPLLTVTLAITAGAAALVGIAVLFREAGKLQSAGNQTLENAVGKTASVYIRIPANKKGAGKIMLTFQGRFSECGAVSAADRDLKPGECVRVVGLEDENTLIVVPVQEQTKNETTEVNHG